MTKCRENRRLRMKRAKRQQSRLEMLKPLRLTDESIDKAVKQAKRMLTKEEWNDAVVRGREMWLKVCQEQKQ